MDICTEHLAELTFGEQVAFGIRVIPDIPKGKTLYWIWAGEVMPVTYQGLWGGCVSPDDGHFHVTCKMKTKKSRTFSNGRKKPIVVDAGSLRMFYAERLGEEVFFNKKDAQSRANSWVEAG